jgi:hypothetical protein
VNIRLNPFFAALLGAIRCGDVYQWHRFNCCELNLVLGSDWFWFSYVLEQMGQCLLMRITSLVALNRVMQIFIGTSFLFMLLKTCGLRKTAAASSCYAFQRKRECDAIIQNAVTSNNQPAAIAPHQCLHTATLYGTHKPEFLRQASVLLALIIINNLSLGMVICAAPESCFKSGYGFK